MLRTSLIVASLLAASACQESPSATSREGSSRPRGAAVVARFQSSTEALTLAIDGGERWLVAATPAVGDFAPFAQAVARAGGTTNGMVLWGSELTSADALHALGRALRDADVTRWVNCRAELRNCR